MRWPCRCRAATAAAPCSILDEREADIIRKEAATAWLHAHPDDLNGFLSPELDEGKRAWVLRQQLPELVTDIAMAFIRSAKDNRLTPEGLQARLAAAPAPLPLAEMGLAIYADYQRALTYRGAVDFDDLIRLAIELLENDPEYLERLRYRWPYILEDEAQDSSKLQEQILRLLAGSLPGRANDSAAEIKPERGNWVRVGDPNQAIFETFTTASPEHLLNFIHDEADEYRELPDSGRCQPSIIELANQLIHWVNNEHPAAQARGALTVPFIQAAPEGDPQPNPPDDPGGLKLIGRKYTPEEEVEAVVKSIERWLPEHREATLAVLVPRNLRGVDVIDALKRRNIDFLELLGSTSSTRQAAGRIGEVVSALAEPQSSARLSKAYLAWRRTEEETPETDFQRQVARYLSKCSNVESYISPRAGNDWLSALAATNDTAAEEEKNALENTRLELEGFRDCLRSWQEATLLPIDQMILTLGQDLFTSPNDLALAHKLALALQQASRDHTDWRLPELTGELALIARNERRFLGFSEDEAGFDPSKHAGKVVVTTMHKAKGLEWERVYLMSVNNYDFPSLQTNDRYISEKWFVREHLNLEAETLAQLQAILTDDEYHWYEPGQATQQARLDYVRERLRLFYVGITRAKKDLIITWNTGRTGEQTQALPFSALQGWWEGRLAGKS